MWLFTDEEQSMSVSLEKRVAAFEEQMALLRRGGQAKLGGREWLDDLYGRFAGDPIFAQAMKLGAKYRRSLRPTRSRNKTKS
jgi:hypothetical protein